MMYLASTPSVNYHYYYIDKNTKVEIILLLFIVWCFIGTAFDLEAIQR